jgi:glutathionyl-hydroquinone reductase
MGMMLQGVWRDVPRDFKSTGGAFVRPDAAFRESVSLADAEPGRFCLYVSRACPWAHRTLIVRAFARLEKRVPAFYADPYMAQNGWEFSDPSNSGGIRYLHELYSKAKPDYTGRVSVPALWDAKEGRIVNNESSEIIRMMGADLYPAKLRKEIDAVNERVYRTLNNGVYRAGFARAQDKYDEAVTGVFATLDWLEKRLAKRRWLCGGKVTEADVRLFTTLVRFDAVYYSHFKCNLRRLTDYPRLWRYTRRFYALPGVARTVDLAEIKAHYYRSQKDVNPTQVVPRGPALDFRLP